MSIRIVGASLCVLALFSGAACHNTNCEQGAYCVDGEPAPKRAGRECLLYCGKVGACGGDEAQDYDACVADCEARFESEPEETAVLCACAEWSSCDDVKQRRCSALPNPNTGGAAGTGGNASGGAAGSSGGAAGSGGAGGATTDGGPAGSGGTAGSGSGGTTSTIPCGRDCDCPLPDVCVAGFCTAPDA
jgi:hypothetical protein